MLGGEQSGHIEAIGFEMYTTMLEEAVRKIKGEEEKPAHAGTAINLGISVRIDSSYIPEENQRLRMYKLIAAAEVPARPHRRPRRTARPLWHPPESVLNLLAAGELRLRCEQLGIAQLDRKRTQVELPNPTANTSTGPQHTMLKRHQPAKPVIKTFVEMLHLKFAEPLSGEASARGQPKIDPGTLMRLVSRNTKRGAQFTPQGILRWPLTSAKSEDVLAETRALLDALESRSA